MFSAGVKLTGADDFIAPSQSCIKPIFGTESSKEASNPPKDLKKILNATLADCLSCSGCVTSAEEVFLQQQGLDELKAILKSLNDKTLIFSFSPQSLTQIMKTFNLTPQKCISKISGFLRTELSVNYIFSTSFFNEFSIYSLIQEFLTLYNSFVNKSSINNEENILLTGICPGWVCYAEKIHQNLVKNLSKIRSHQSIAGSFFKSHFCQFLNIPIDKIFHVSIQPCFDRKLEAFRPDLVVDFDGISIKEVDHVISTFEFEKLLSDFGGFSDLGFNNIVDFRPDEFDFIVSEGNGSGGLALNVFLSVCRILFGIDVSYSLDDFGFYVWNLCSGFRVINNINRPDFYEWSLVRRDSEKVVLKFFQVYGFKNIQNFINKMKKLKNEEFVVFCEIMACPGRGCLNGGGQIDPSNRKLSNTFDARENLKVLEKIYNGLSRYSREFDSEIIKDFINSKGVKINRKFYMLEKQNDILKW